jgi:teichuronic acid biosynthesis glycosyltransferase TuaH
LNELVVLSLEAWDDVWRRNQYLVAGLMERDPSLRVLFVEPASDPLYALRRGDRPRPGRGLRRAAASSGADPERLWLHQPTKVLPRRLDPRTDVRFARSVVRAARRLAFTSPVLWINDPGAATMLRTSTWPALYDITDDWLAARRSPAERDRLGTAEATLLERCAAVTVCSPALARTKGGGRTVELITNAVDVDRYRRPHERPADLPAGPCVLYVGTLHTDRLDVRLTVELAEALRGEATVVLVGPVALDGSDADRLRRGGVVLLGARPYTTVPAYLQHAAALVVPHVVDEFTDSLDPLKLYEYRAVGRPVVATPVAGFRDLTDPLVTVGSGEDFVSGVREALRAPSGLGPVPPEIPRWEAQVEAMAGVVGRLRQLAPTPR